jgi:hypothetical protein
VTLDDWQALGIICGAILAALTLLNLAWRKAVQPMFRSFRLAARLIEQLVGDKGQGVPSLMEQLAEVRDNQVKQAEQTAKLAAETAEVQREQRQHLAEWHSVPLRAPVNGPAPRRKPT